MSIVLDIDVVVDGCRPDGGASYELMVRIASGKLKTYCSPELHADYGVALQGAVQRREVRLSSAKASQLLDSWLGGGPMCYAPVTQFSRVQT